MRFLHLIFLIGLLALTSCNMSRWYFRHGGKSQETSFKREQSESTLSVYAEQTISSDTSRRIQFDEPQAVKEMNQPTAVTTNDEFQLKTLSPVTELESVKKNPQEHFSKRKLYDSGRSRPSGASIAAFIILLILLVFILWGLFIFLISWIFVSAAVALRIALWGMLITLGVSLLVSIILSIIDL